MANSIDGGNIFFLLFCFMFFPANIVDGINIFLEWHVAIDTGIKPVSVDQPVITINGMFPGPLINCTTNDYVHVNLFNELDEPLLITWNGIEQRLDSWQDGVLGTNCPIEPGQNWTYVFKTKDQVGSFCYFPSTNFQKAAGGFGSIRVNNRIVIPLPFPKPDQDFDLLIGDWYNQSHKEVRSHLDQSPSPSWMLMNGKAPFGNQLSLAHESLTVSRGKTYQFRISNVGTKWSFNFRIQNHTMLLVETEGSYTNQTQYESLDIHVGQSYSVLVTMDQNDSDYYIVASPKLIAEATGNRSTLVGVGVLHYGNSTSPPSGPFPPGPDPFDIDFSVRQAKSIRWNMAAGAARPNPQRTFNVTKVKPNQTFVLQGGPAVDIGGVSRYTVNNVSYLNPSTALKLGDYVLNGSGVYSLDEFPVLNISSSAVNGTFVATGIHKEWLEIVLVNDHEAMDSWHLDGFGFFVVGFGNGTWTPDLRSSYNVYDPVVRSTVQVYPKGWAAVYVYMDNPGMWNLRSQNLKYWYLGQELYIRVYDPDNSIYKELPPPQNILLCGIVHQLPPPPISPPPPMLPSPPQKSSALALYIEWLPIALGLALLICP